MLVVISRPPLNIKELLWKEEFNTCYNFWSKFSCVERKILENGKHNIHYLPLLVAEILDYLT